MEKGVNSSGDWAEKLGRRLTDSSVTPPESVWNGISGHIETPRRRVAVPVYWAFAAAAACLAAVLLVRAPWNGPAAGSTERDGFQQIELLAENPATEGLVAEGLVAETPAVQGAEEGTAPAAEPARMQETAEEQQPETVQEKPETVKEKPAERYVTDVEFPAEPEDKRSGSGRRVLIAANISGNSGTETVTSEGRGTETEPPMDPPTGPPTDPPTDPPGSDEGDNEGNGGIARIMRAPAMASKAQETSIQHSRPLTIGVSATVPITENIFVQSGLEFTRLHSDITENGKKQVQNLCLVCIPAMAGYTTSQYNGLSFAVQAGAKAGKCIYAHSCGENFSEPGLQAAVVAGASVRFSIGRNIGLFFMPEWSYWLTRTELDTYVTEHPSSLSFKAGVDISLGK